MDKVVIFAKIGIGVAFFDALIRFAGPLYTTANQPGSIGVLLIPGFAMLISYFLIKAKKIGIYLSIIFALLSFIGMIALMRPNSSSSVLFPLLYLIVYGILAFLALQQSKNFK